MNPGGLELSISRCMTFRLSILISALSAAAQTIPFFARPGKAREHISQGPASAEATAWQVGRVAAAALGTPLR